MEETWAHVDLNNPMHGERKRNENDVLAYKWKYVIRKYSIILHNKN